MLVANWRAIVRKTWSIRLMLLAGVLSAVEVMLPFFAHEMPRGVFAGLSGLVVAAAFVARLMAQRGISDEG